MEGKKTFRNFCMQTPFYVIVNESEILFFYVYLYYLQIDDAFKLQLGKKISGVTSH